MTSSVRGNLGVEADARRLIACLPQGPIGTALNDSLGPLEFEVLDGVLFLGPKAWADCKAAVPTIRMVVKANMD